jgi:hypothetical protein
VVVAEGGVGGSPGERGEGLVEVEALVGEPAAFRGAGRVLAGERGVEAVGGLGELDGEVAAEGEVGARAQDSAPGVGAGEALGADAGGHPGHVAGGVGGLHAGDHAELGEAGEVGEVEDLGVLEAHAWGAWQSGGSGEGAGVGVEDDAVASVADRVGGRLPAAS